MKKIISNKILKNVRKLQIRIAKAVSENNWRKVKSLSRLLTNSFYAKLISIFKVVTNKGKQTAGVDKEIWTKEDIISKTKVIERRQQFRKKIFKYFKSQSNKIKQYSPCPLKNSR